ncbi:phosphatase PAP2 family protein [Streptomyces sp. ITFR-6]|uniref:phosphatase PAP2 family protein n=1 Tax=Streptomyces sp. ITFR-6 TaxID=3075197 RepID=UPI00288BA17C|nr:phosphatase PAP2 family protein [Streptomyces sp. ITFR-6]WNI30739.1 phosphatase PAP2 family protein [Streptomyces sp. ITFR-6]
MSTTGTADGTDSSPEDARTTSTARTVTDVFQPRNLLLAGMLATGSAAAGEWTGLLWGLLGALCAGIIPAGYIEWERGRGTWGDRHVVDRTKRAPIFFVILGSIGVGSAVMVLGGAPSGILTAMLGLWAMTVVLLAVNTVWKISVDASVASAVVALLAVVHSPWWLFGYLMTAAVCWSRVVLGYHTVSQVTAGTALGAATACAFLFG